LWAYLGVFAALVAAGLGFPIPEEIPVVTAGALAGQVDDPKAPPPDVAGLLAAAPGLPAPAGLPWAELYRCANPEPDPKAFRVRWWIMLPVCILGVVLSDGLLFGLGRLFGTRLLEHRFVARMVPHEKRERIESNFHKYGIKILLFARFLPGIRAPIFITAGIMRLPLSRFLLADGLYAIPGVSLLFGLAFWFTNSFKELIERAEHWRPLLIVIAIVVVVVLFLVHVLRRPVHVGDPKELPIIGPQIAQKVAGEAAAPAPAEPEKNGEAVKESHERPSQTDTHPHI
jgi:membrane protein DedA with SNARE-associated domain